MKGLFWFPLLLAASCAPQVAVDGSASPSVNRPAPSFPTVQAVADAAVREGRVPAITIAVGIANEPTRFISAGRIGLQADATNATPDTLWRIYSMTKPVTGIAAMILVDEGKLDLDQPISDFIPEFEAGRILVDPAKSLETRPAGRPITVRHLLTHTGGLNYGTGGDTPAVAELKRTGAIPYAFDKGSEAELKALRPNSLQEFGRRAAQNGLLSEPGTRFSYSMGLDVLAVVVEKAAGMPFEAFLEQRLFAPLAMTSTYWQVPRSEAGRLIGNYADPAIAKILGLPASGTGNGKFALIDEAANSLYLDPPSFAYGGAGLVSSARDYDRFLHMLQNDGTLDGVRILSAPTARLAKSNLLPTGVSYKNFGPIMPNEETGFGAGGFVTTLAIDGLGRHRGTFGWDGAAGTRGWVDTERAVRVTTMINIFGAAGLTNEIDKAVAADMAARH